MEVTIRSACPADVGILYGMLCELENEKLDREAFDTVFQRNLNNENIAYLIAEIEGVSVGMAGCHVQLLLHHAAAIAEIQEMYVNPTFRSKGIGRKLIVAIRQFAERLGANQIEVTSNLIRLDTHRFYEREGFRKSHAKLVLKF